MMKRVLVIVVTYNGMQWLERCLGSVLGTARKGPGDGPSRAVAVDVYVWDNDSADGSADFVAAHYPQAKLIRSAENLGFSIPNNKGMEYALSHGYDYVYLLNQDAWLEPGAMEKLVAAAESHPEYGVLSPMQYSAGLQGLDPQFVRCLKGTKAPSGARRRACLCPWHRDDGQRHTSPGAARVYEGAEPPVLSAKRVMAAHWLVPVRVIRQIGLFEEGLFPHWGQDDDWCNCLHFCGLKIGVVKEALAVHDRALREEPQEKLIRRNYYTGSLVRLCNVNRPLLINFLFIILFTFVKALKYRSCLPFSYFRTICGRLPEVRARRSLVRTRAHNAQ